MQYALYARTACYGGPSHPGDIESQVALLRDLAKQRSLPVAAELTECGAANSPGDRPIFDELIKRVEAGSIDGILVVDVERLSRNAAESLQVSRLLESGVLSEIVTLETTYRSGADIPAFHLQELLADQLIRDRSAALRRGRLQGASDMASIRTEGGGV